MTSGREKLLTAIDDAGSMLCIGIDPHPELLSGTSAEALVEWGRPIIEIGSEWCAAFKFNVAFFEAFGAVGWSALTELFRIVPPERFAILDGKRGDIGSTASAYAHAAFSVLGAHAVTVNPYMGLDAIEPFADAERLVFVLALTSNPGARDFQLLCCDGMPLYEQIVRKVLLSPFSEEVGFVVGASMPEHLASVRQIVGSEVPLLIPGIGAQGGDLDAVLRANADGVALINLSRALLHPYREGGIADFRAAVKRYSALLPWR